MVKNFIIVLQAIIILLGGIWAYECQHRVEQILLVTGISEMANDARLFVKVERRIAGGQPETAQRILHNVAASNVEDLKKAVEKLDLSMDDHVAKARQSAALLQAVGIFDISGAIDRRLKEKHN